MTTKKTPAKKRAPAKKKDPLDDVVYKASFCKSGKLFFHTSKSKAAALRAATRAAQIDGYEPTGSYALRGAHIAVTRHDTEAGITVLVGVYRCTDIRGGNLDYIADYYYLETDAKDAKGRPFLKL